MRLYVVKNNAFTGTYYEEFDQKYFDHHEQYQNESCLWLSSPLEDLRSEEEIKQGVERYFREPTRADYERTVRKKRDLLLKNTDWMVLTDTDLKDDPSVLAYRQELRDIPEQEGFPYTVQWPEDNS